jgi:tripartite-type tricarboxylate transporter receptor subunit TctC
MSRRVIAAFGWALLACASTSLAQNYPSRPLRIVVPFPPGGGNDVLARAVAPRLQERNGQPVVVENRPGASGNIGVDAVAKAPGDGHTILVAQSGVTMNPWLQKSLPFDIQKDFIPLTIVGTQVMAAVVHPSVPASTIAELVAHLKAHPGKLSYATPGIGTPHHLGTELFLHLTGTRMLHVPYKGAAGMVPAVMANDVQLLIGALNSIIPHAKAGRIRALGTGGKERAPTLPEAPTIAESVPGYEFSIWYGFIAPAGVPEPIAAKLVDELRTITTLPDVKEQLTKVGFDVNPSTAAEMREVLRVELEKWGKLVREIGLKAE